MLDDLRSLPSDIDEDAAFLIPGTRFGRYTLVRRLAIGGMAEIHLARASGLSGFEKTVVLKRILPQYAAMEDFVEMFLDEARLGASLDHANIVQVHDVGQVGRSYFMAMEYLQGQDVRNVQAAARKHARPLTLGEALSIAIPTAAGLHYAHEKRGADGKPLHIVHRDVSPANVIVTRDGCVKIVDFGIAKSAIRNTQTRAGTLKGKISYMSPEQCRGDAIDRRSDVFALGIVLYELCCGVRPFNGDNEYAILSQIIGSSAPAPSAKQPDFPVELERILLKALKPLPEERYQSTRELQVDLEAYVRSERLEIGPMVLAQMLEELAFTYRTDVQGQLPDGVELPLPAPGAPLDDELAYSLVMDAGVQGGFDDGPSARLENELLVHERELERERRANTGSGARASTGGSRRISKLGPAVSLAQPVSSPAITPTLAPAGAFAHRTRNRWLIAGAAALVLAGVAIGASLGRGGSKAAPAAAAPGSFRPAPGASNSATPGALPSAQLAAFAATAAPTPTPAAPAPAPSATAAPAPAPVAAPAPAPVAAPAPNPAATPAPTRPAAAATPRPATARPRAASPRPAAPAKAAASSWDPDSPLPPPH